MCYAITTYRLLTYDKLAPEDHCESTDRARRGLVFLISSIHNNS